MMKCNITQMAAFSIWLSNLRDMLHAHGMDLSEDAGVNADNIVVDGISLCVRDDGKLYSAVDGKKYEAVLSNGHDDWMPSLNVFGHKFVVGLRDESDWYGDRYWGRLFELAFKLDRDELTFGNNKHIDLDTILVHPRTGEYYSTQTKVNDNCVSAVTRLAIEYEKCLEEDREEAVQEKLRGRTA